MRNNVGILYTYKISIDRYNLLIGILYKVFHPVLNSLKIPLSSRLNKLCFEI